MKKILSIIILLLPLIFVRIPPYKELNNIAIIEKIIVIKKENKYILYLKEKIPIKNNQGIKYEYKTYKSTDYNLYNCLNIIKNRSKKQIYINKAKYLITNIKNTNLIKKCLGINPKHIIYKNKINKAEYN